MLRVKNKRRSSSLPRKYSRKKQTNWLHLIIREKVPDSRRETDFSAVILRHAFYADGEQDSCYGANKATQNQDGKFKILDDFPKGFTLNRSSVDAPQII